MPELYDESIRYSWSYWLPFVLPSVVLWAAVFSKRALAPGQIGVKPIFAACVLFNALFFYHCCRVHDSQVDPTDDTWFLFAPVAIMFRTPLVCGLSLIVAVAIREIFALLRRRRLSPPQLAELD